MMADASPRFWTTPRLFGWGVAALVVAIFIAANAHLFSVAFATHPDCALPPVTEGAVTYRAAKPTC